MVEFHQIRIALAAMFSPASDPFGQDTRTGPVGPGPVQGADAERTDAARARSRRDRSSRSVSRGGGGSRLFGSPIADLRRRLPVPARAWRPDRRA